MMLHYKSTPAWSEEEQTTSKETIEKYITVQQMQLQKCINEAQKIQWQHEDNTSIQEMLLTCSNWIKIDFAMHETGNLMMLKIN